MSTNKSHKRTNTSPPYLSRATVLRMQRLLHMEYKPSELSEELCIPQRHIYEIYIPTGLPHRRDDANNTIWIVGTQFREWALAALETRRRLKKDRKQPIGENQGYCVRCKAVADFKEISKIVTLSNNRIQVYGICSLCGTNMVNLKKKGAA